MVCPVPEADFIVPSLLAKKKFAPTCNLVGAHVCVRMFSFFIFLQNYQLYKISFIDAGKYPILYSLVDLMDAPIQGRYYKEQLTKGRKPTKSQFFRMEKILRTKKENGQKMHLVKYLHYPNKFNRWVYESDLLK